MASSNIGSSFFFIANLLNFVLATAIFTIPFPMYEVGIILGTIILCTTCFLSIIACTFIIEALAMKNYFKKNASLILETANKTNDSDVMGNEAKESSHIVVLIKEPFTDTDDNIKEDNLEEQDNFFISKRYEISILGKLMVKPLYFLVVFTMICYLYVGVTSNGIIAGTNLLDIIGRSLGVTLSHNYYYLVVSIFFTLTILVALNNIMHLKKFSMFIMCCRFIVILTIIGCCFYSIAVNGPAKYSEIKTFDFKNITVMIGNSLFVFMSHHSIPGMVEGFSPQKNLMKLLIIGYICSLLFMLFYGYLSVFAFGKQSLSCDKNIFPTAIQATFSSNFLGLSFIGYIINYYPVLNIITSGMQLITLRNNILEAIGGCSGALKKRLTFADQTGAQALAKNFVFNLVVCIPPIIIGLTLSNIQSLMKYFSSVFGFMLMLVVPAVIIYNYRRYFEKRGYVQGNLNRSFVTAYWGLYTLGGVAVIVFSLIIYGFIRNVPAKKCINE